MLLPLQFSSYYCPEFMVPTPNRELDSLPRIVSRAQRHHCTDQYCLRRKKLPENSLSEEKFCRFYFPQPVHTSADLVRNLNPKYYVFDGARNDPILYNYNRTTSLGWLANTDIASCTDWQSTRNQTQPRGQAQPPNFHQRFRLLQKWTRPEGSVSSNIL